MFFAVEEIETTWHDDNRGEWRTREATDWDVIGDAGEAAKFCERAGLTILRDFGDFPLRPQPESLRRRFTCAPRRP